MRDFGSNRILIVEDEDSVRALLRHAFERRGHAVETVVDGLDAIALLERERFAMIIMDLVSRRSSGYEVLTFLAQRNIGTPIFLLTEEEDTFVTKAASDAVLAILRKPVDVDLLADTAGAVCAEIHAGRLDPQRRYEEHRQPAEQPRM